MTIDQKLLDLGIELPPVPQAAGLYKTFLLTGKTVTFYGHLPIRSDGSIITGKVGVDLSIEDATFAARQVGLNILSTLLSATGDLDRVDRVGKILGMVNANSDFTSHPAVINGCSELFLEVFGEERGVGTRSAFGVSGLPANAAVEIEGVFYLK